MGAWYHATKHALEGLSDVLRLELAEHGIDVVIIEPGAIKTEWGDIAVENMMETSGSGPYADFAAKTKALMDRAYADGAGSPPSVVAEAIAQAIEADRPKTRYVIGQNAKPALVGRWLLPDRAFDAVIRSQLR
jgi:NAD(P)-dependent dehydrogenase (short-subunit alcohol dehydrogenase family)